MNPPTVLVDLPAGWSHRADIAPFALIARAEPWDGAFVPNLTLVLTPAPTDATIETYLAGQLAGVAESLADAELIDVALERSDSVIEFLVAHSTTGVDLTMLQRHRITPDGWVVALCVTAADQDWPRVERDLRALVRSARRAP